MRGIQNLPEVVAAKTRRIHEIVIHDSETITQGNFTKIAIADLERLFKLYDNVFFSGLLHKWFHEEKRSISFRLSKRMTRAGGKTTCTRKHSQGKDNPKQVEVYEIAISTPLLFQTFKDVKRAIKVNGIECQDRLEALQRIFEHELIHLLEMLAWRKSSCAASNFKSLAAKIFAHTEVTHQLVTQYERARINFGIGVGEKVTFEYKGKQLGGFVNRITKRATVLVENKKGMRYSDGKRYVKYYIPLSDLKKVSS
ncbi:MAG: SprT-like family protein [Candidatus Hodarchaeota archaeon]